MAVFVDTSFLWAFLDERDASHSLARDEHRRLASGEEGAVLSNDFVYAEAQALARKSSRSESAVRAVEGFFFSADTALQVMRVDARAFEEARRMQLARISWPLTFVDWTIVVQAKRLRCRRLATYDGALADAFDELRTA